MPDPLRDQRMIGTYGTLYHIRRRPSAIFERSNGMGEGWRNAGDGGDDAPVEGVRDGRFLMPALRVKAVSGSELAMNRSCLSGKVLSIPGMDKTVSATARECVFASTGADGWKARKVSIPGRFFVPSMALFPEQEDHVNPWGGYGFQLRESNALLQGVPPEAADAFWNASHDCLPGRTLSSSDDASRTTAPGRAVSFVQ